MSIHQVKGKQSSVQLQFWKRVCSAGVLLASARVVVSTKLKTKVGASSDFCITRQGSSFV